MIGITTYRDYFSSGLITKRKSIKTESLLQYVLDLNDLFQGVELRPTRIAREPGFLNSMNGVVLFDHPSSLISSNTLSGFTTSNLCHHSEQLRHLINFEGPIYAVSAKRHLYPKWAELYTRRVERGTDPPDVNWPDPAAVTDLLVKSVDRTREYDILRKRPFLIFGDSHSTMLWKPGWTCHNSFGLTLYRALENGLASGVEQKIDKAIYCYGNIDLRYHLARRVDPFESTKELAREYISQASKTADEVKICSLLPVTTEIKGIAKAYLYKGQQSYGSIDLRKELSNVFRDECLKVSKGTNIKIIDPPVSLFDENGVLKQELQEARGVHISPIAYEYCLSSGCDKPRPEYAWTLA